MKFKLVIVEDFVILSKVTFQFVLLGRPVSANSVPHSPEKRILCRLPARILPFSGFGVKVQLPTLIVDTLNEKVFPL